MLLPLPYLRKQLEAMVKAKTNQGYETKGLLTRLKDMPDSYDAFASFADHVQHLPFRGGWRYVEPSNLDGIWAECDPARPLGRMGDISGRDIADKIKAAFLGSVCGCILGKPLEVDPTLDEIRNAAVAVGEWPINDYISEALLTKLGRRHPDAVNTTRETIQYVAPDDDLNYTTIGMLVLENKGAAFTKRDLVDIWVHNLPPHWAWGPERLNLVRAGLHWDSPEELRFDDWADTWNAREEACGAAIRVDAYGFACPGRPALAAELAWRDSSWTHRKTGIYGSMFIAAAIAAAFTAKSPLEIFRTALQFVPRRSRFYETMSDCMEMVSSASDWLDGYSKINAKYGQYRHCQIYQECGHLINSAHFATDTADAFCKQVSQGADTDCFGKIIGSIMGAYFGPAGLDSRWLKPFHDDYRTALGLFYERSLTAVAERMARLPEGLHVD